MVGTNLNPRDRYARTTTRTFLPETLVLPTGIHASHVYLLAGWVLVGNKVALER